MVTTFQLDSAGVQRLSEHRTMREASATLPAGAYTTFRTYGGNRVLRLDQHIRRLEESVALMGQPASLDGLATRRGIVHALRATGYPESRFRLTFAPPALFITIEPFTPYPPALYESGVWCVTLPLRRQNPQAKSTAFIASAADAYAALPAGAHEGLMVGEDGAILEGLSSNFFAVLPCPDEGHAPELRTEDARILAGVTRAIVLELAQALLPVSYRAATCAELVAASECFITSVSREVLPVVKIDGQIIGDGRPGPIARALMQRFREMVAREAEALQG
jgi:branched-chain amino acid aminotransferase